MPESGLLAEAVREFDQYFSRAPMMQWRGTARFRPTNAWGKRTRLLARELQVELPLHNPFKSIVVRALEVVFACEEALRIIASYEVAASPAIDCRPRPGSGFLHAADTCGQRTLYAATAGGTLLAPSTELRAIAHSFAKRW